MDMRQRRKEEYSKVIKYLRWWRDYFDLRGHEISIAFAPWSKIAETLDFKDDEIGYAALYYDDVHNRVNIYFDEELPWVKDDYDIEYVLLHELSHIKTRVYQNFVRGIINNMVPASCRKYLEENLVETEEKVVDSFARLLYNATKGKHK